MATGNAVLGELLGKDGGTGVQELLRRLRNTNPCIGRFIQQLASRHRESAEVYAAALVVYRLLESQDEADRMSEEFFWKETDETSTPPVSSPELRP